jgi:D-lactate dehydrogenase
MLPSPYRQLHEELAVSLPSERLVVDPLRLLAWGTDASFYRLVPKLLVVVDDEAELRRVLAACARLGTPVTFRAAGTSLSGQALSDSVLIMLGDGWRGIEVAADGASIHLQPGVIVARRIAGSLRWAGRSAGSGLDRRRE